jgi:hypothetical protein
MAEPHTGSGWRVFAHSIKQYGRVCAADVEHAKADKKLVGLAFIGLMGSSKFNLRLCGASRIFGGKTKDEMAPRWI